MDKTLFNDMVIYFLAGLSVCLVIVNSVCITVIAKSPELRKRPAIIFIVNLLVTHLLQGLIVLPIYAVKKSKDYPASLYPVVCATWRMTYMLTFYGTCINVLLVSVDRFIATKYALSQKVKLTCKHCILICCLAWIYMLLLCLIPFAPIERTISNQGSWFCHYNQPKEWTIFMLIGNTVVPFILVFAIYIYIIYTLRQNSQNANNTNNSVNHKITALTIKITLTYGLTWLPSIVYYNIVTIKPDLFSDSFYVSDEEAILTFLIKYITFFDGAVAPLLYCCSSGDFRKAFFRMVSIRRRAVSNVVIRK